MSVRSIRAAAVAVVTAAATVGALLPVAGAEVARAHPAPATGLVADPTRYVDPMIGTGNGGDVVGDINDFPGVDTPFGMMQLSPDTQGSGVGYGYGKTEIRGFSMDHASAGCGVFGDVPILPTTGAVPADPNSATGTFSHDHERATLGSYQVLLTDSGVHVGLTATTRTGLLSFRYPAGRTAQVLVKAGTSLGGNSGATISVDGSREVSGSAVTNGLCGLGKYTVFFDVRFSRPFAASGTWTGNSVKAGSSSATGTGSGAYLTFDTATSKLVRAKVSMSYVSVNGARNNMAHEITGWKPAPVERNTRAAWRRALSTVRVGGGTDADLTSFYTALYHSLQFPSVFNDVDGRYVGFDDRVHHLPAGQTQYATFSDWDTYRAVAPLQAMLFPTRAGQMANSLLRDARQQGGWMPRWPVANVSTTGTMNGDNAVPLIANLVAFGAKGVNIRGVLPIMLKGANHSKVLGWGFQERQCVEEYVRLGYAPNDACSQGAHGRQGVSETLEWAIDDFAISRLAAAVGDRRIADKYQLRSQNWQNTFNPTTGYLQPRDEHGAFPNGPAFVPPPVNAFGQDGYDEGNAADYGWEVPQNMAGLIGAMGSKDVATARLDRFFQQDNAGPNEPYMWAGNEVDLSVPYVYDYLGQPWKTQAQVRKQEQQFYPPTPDGLPGNDDLGAMSVWYVWSALGVYPMTPGTPDLAMGSPLFRRAAVRLGSGHTLDVHAPAAGENGPYVSGLRVDGRRYSSTGLPRSLATLGGRLDVDLATTPDTGWGAGRHDAPPSYQRGQDPAIGFTRPSGPVVFTAGDTRHITVGVQGTGLHRTHVRWHAVGRPSGDDGITVSPAHGRFVIGADGRASVRAAVSVPASIASGYYPVRFAFATNAGRRLPGGVLVMTVQADDHTAVVADDLGDPDAPNGITVADEGDGHTAATTAGGMPGRTTSGAGSNYMYFNIDNSLVPGGRYQATAYVSYYDHGTGSWDIQYDSYGSVPNNAYRDSARVTDTGTDSWKTAVIPLPEASLSGRENGGTDLRLNIGAGAQAIGRIAITVTGDNVLALHLATVEPTAPTVTSQPADVTATGGAVTFTSTAVGDPDPLVQWQVETPGGMWTDLAGATHDSLTLDRPGDYPSGTQFRARFTNLAGVALSGAATLTDG
jgi:predicted alpha-1,2-mannosidase